MHVPFCSGRLFLNWKRPNRPTHRFVRQISRQNCASVLLLSSCGWNMWIHVGSCGIVWKWSLLIINLLYHIKLNKIWRFYMILLYSPFSVKPPMLRLFFVRRLLALALRCRWLVLPSDLQRGHGQDLWIWWFCRMCPVDRHSDKLFCYPRCSMVLEYLPIFTMISLQNWVIFGVVM